MIRIVLRALWIFSASAIRAPEPTLVIFKEICAIEENDGILFDVEALRVELIREKLACGGLGLRTIIAWLAGARITVVIDIGFGDAVEPGVEKINLPVLLDLSVPRLRAYARETVVAKRFQAMVLFGLANTRMNNYYDIWILSRSYVFDAERLSRAIAATFERRGTVVPEDLPDALTPAFSTDAKKQRQWEALAGDLSAEVPSLEAIVADLAAFLMPQARQALQRTSGRLRTEIRRHPTQLNKTNKLTHPKSKQPYRKWPFSHSPGPSSRLRCWLLSVTKTPCSNSCEQAIITRRMYQTACSSERLTYWRTNPAASNVSNNH